jgi:RsiW-degrading membrane proteinase PrsW (M82 family)
MSLNKPIHVIAFAVVLGIIAYLASAVWSALFIVSLPMDEDAITDAVELESGEDRYGNPETEWVPIEFKNSLEELKYYHNVKMRDRNGRWVVGQTIAGGFLGLLVFFIVPKLRGNPEQQRDATGDAIGSVFLGIVVVLLVPLVLSWLLPPPAKWFPRKIVSIAETNREEALTHLKGIARKMDAERNDEW